MGSVFHSSYKTKENVTCPVCGKHTFEREFDHDICPVCGWENEIVFNPESGGGANGVSLNEARSRYAKYGTIELKEK